SGQLRISPSSTSSSSKSISVSHSGHRVTRFLSFLGVRPLAGYYIPQVSSVGERGCVKVTVQREYPERPLVGVGGVVIQDGRALLIRRGGPPLQGEWSIPGGTLELGESIADGIRRELLEETGVEVRVGELIEVFDRIFPDVSGRIQYHFVIVDYLCEVVRGEARAGSDVTDIAWAREEELPRYSLSAAANRVIRRAFALAAASASARPEPKS